MLSHYAAAGSLSFGKFVVAFTVGASLMVAYFLYLLFTLFPNSYLAIELWFIYHADKTPMYFTLAAGSLAVFMLSCILFAWLTHVALRSRPLTANTPGVNPQGDDDKLE